MPNNIKTIKRLLTLASPAGYAICACSAVFSVGFVLLGIEWPAFQVQNTFKLISYGARIGGGLSVTLAQIYGFIFYKLTGDNRSQWLYRGATSISIYMSICTFYSMIAAGNIDALADAKAKAKSELYSSAVYQALLRELKHAEDMINEIEADRAITNQRYNDANLISKKVSAGIEYNKRISKYENKKAEIIAELKKYDFPTATVNTPEQTKVTVAGIHLLIAKDIVKFCAFGTGAVTRIKMFLQYFLLIGLAIIIDMIGVGLILTGAKKGYLSAKITTKLVPESTKNSQKQPSLINDISGAKKAPNTWADETQKDTIETPAPAPQNKEKRPLFSPPAKSIKTDDCGDIDKKSAPTDFDEFDSFCPKKDEGYFMDETWGWTLNEIDAILPDFSPSENDENGPENRRAIFWQNCIDQENENVKKLFGDLGQDAVAKALLGLTMYNSSKEIQEYAFGNKNGTNAGKLKRIADTFELVIPNGNRKAA